MSVNGQELIRNIDLKHVPHKVLILILTVCIYIFYPPQVLCHIQTLVITHINLHPRDISDGILRQSDEGLRMLSQKVLLALINSQGIFG